MKHLTLLISATILLFGSCKKDKNNDMLYPGPNQVVYAINANNELIMFNASNPGTTTGKTAINGIAPGEKLLSIDFRPATGELYGLSSASKLYIINQNDGMARMVGAASFTPLLSGTMASIDFNPTVDRIRLVSNTGQNLRLNPETGTVAATDGDINGGSSPVITGVGYTNSKAGAATTTLYDIDQATGKLFKQDPPNNGTLVEVGSLGITFTGNAAFDISSGNIALLAASNVLYLLDLASGRADKVGQTSETFIDLAIPTENVAYAVDLSNNLLIFNPMAVSNGVITKAITGLQTAEMIHGIDFRPLNGQLYALGSSSRLYTINLSNGTATQVGTGGFITALLGTDFGFDFNPTVDRIRVVSNLGQNLRLHPVDGSIAATDMNMNPGLPMVSSSAYTNSYAGATTTSLFAIDHFTDKLYLQNPPNAGTLVEIGNLGIDIDTNNGFDITSRGNIGYLIATVGSTTSLYTINTTTGLVSSPVIFPMAVKGFSIGTGF